MFNDANKRTAFAAAEELMTRNNIMSGPTAPELWRIIDAVGDSTEAMHTSDIEKIASMLRGY
jgi:prophage maintenance system killer protein